MKNKNLIYGAGAIVVLGVAYYAMKKKKVESGIMPALPQKNRRKVKVAGNATTYVIKDGKKYDFPNAKSYQNYTMLEEVRTIPKSQLDLIPNGADISEAGKITGETTTAFDVNNYTVKSQDSTNLYLVRNGKKHLIKTPSSHLNYLWSEIFTISPEELSSFPYAGRADDSGVLVNK